MKNNLILLGSDPEVFVSTLDGKIVSGIDLIPGDKENPHPIDKLGHAIQVDNIAWEYNIPPCATREDFIKSIHFVKDYLQETANEFGLTLSSLASAEVDEAELQHPNAKRFGCDPDLNVYTLSQNETPDSNTNLRCVGGHVSFGFNEPSIDQIETIVKLFDIFLTAPAVIYDSDTRRRELYGKPGSFRAKEWGVECRALSNFWIMTKELTGWVYDQSLFIANLAIHDPAQANFIISTYSERALEIIDNSDKDDAKYLLEELNEFVTNYIKL